MGCVVSRRNGTSSVGNPIPNRHYGKIEKTRLESDNSDFCSDKSTAELNQEHSQSNSFAVTTKDLLRRSSSKKYFKSAAECCVKKEGSCSSKNEAQIHDHGNPISDGTELKKKVSAAVLIQRRIRGIEARAFAATRKITKQAEESILRSLNPLISPAENACNLLIDIISASISNTQIDIALSDRFSKNL